MPKELTQFRPGQSGNPSGRPKRRPITAAILAELAKAHGRGSTRRRSSAFSKV
jgi:hypothetical protein